MVGKDTLDGKATLSTSGGKREVRNLALSLGQNRIAGDLVLDEKFLPLGTVNFQLPDVGALAALALETVKGDLNGTISFTDNQGKPELAVNATTKSLARGDVTAADVAINATVNDYVAAPAVSGRVQAATVTSGKTVVKGIDVELTQQAGWTGFDGGATVADIPGEGGRPRPGGEQPDGDRTRLRPGDRTRAAGQAGARLARRDRQRHDEPRQCRARHRRRQCRGGGNGGLDAQPQRDADGRARLGREQFRPRPQRGGHHLRHGKGHRRRGQSCGRLYARLERRADGARRAPPVSARSASPPAAILPAAG